ncbi:sialidase-4 [Carlito syrichta]|uniref:Sialidase-4 n=1 Tax=Carlito syrichta TaxID=1868482 RepID=A0A3Q0DQ48_CARSF|nr:sialidase-4 [Carlito syrichta]
MTLEGVKEGSELASGIHTGLAVRDICDHPLQLVQEPEDQAGVGLDPLLLQGVLTPAPVVPGPGEPAKSPGSLGCTWGPFGGTLQVVAAPLALPKSPPLLRQPKGPAGWFPVPQDVCWGLEFRPLLCKRFLSMAAPARTVLFQRERSGLTYRVPALLSVPPGPTLLAFVEQRISPDDSHAHRLVLRRGTLTGGSVRWGALRVLGTAALEEHRSMNPCPVHDAGTGTIFLFFIAVLGHTPEAVQIATGRNAARLCCVTSFDVGLTWSSVRDLTEDAIGGTVQDWATFAVGPGHGVQLPSGRLLVPAYAYRVDRRECFGKICLTSPHSFAFYSDDHGRSWHSGGLVPNLRSGECQLALVDGGQAGAFLYCNARSPLGSRVQALSADQGTSFLPGELVPTLPETARGCQGSIVGFPAPPSSRPWDEGWSKSPKSLHNPPRLCSGVQEAREEVAGGATGGQVPVGPFSHSQSQGDGPGQPGPGPGFGGDMGSWALALPVPSIASQSPTWLLYSHPAGRRARLHMGIHLSRSPLDPHGWTEPWVIYEGPSGYSDLASIRLAPMGAMAFGCLFESGARTSYEEISFCMFSLRDVLKNVPPDPQLPHWGPKPQGCCWPS